ncbi:AEC family transporter [Ideonella sp. 4Y16]|uniref:AEC family transporter n=1 Tax=Ideonella alba TaxID=2824118 RepID=UPI001B374225|nr:AEC family transporter [Ideonella alba]MBQ0944897.1 AEC family transporter [Ideonella alba]
MTQILSITAPIYLLMAVGFLSVRSGWLEAGVMRAVGLFVIRVALPALLFQIVTSRPLAEMLQWRFLLAYGGGSVLSFALGWWWARRREPSMRALMGAGMSCSNTGFVGTPVLMTWMGAAAAPALALVFLVENLVVLPLLFVLAEPASNRSRAWQRLRDALAPLARQPMLLAIVGGLLWSALGLTMPPPLARSIDLLGRAAAGAALVVIGGALAGLHKGHLDKDLLVVALGKLVGHPLAVALCMLPLLPAGDPLRAAGIVAAAAPMLSIYPMLAQRHGHEGFCAAALLLATASSFLSLSGVLWLLS